MGTHTMGRGYAQVEKLDPYPYPAIPYLLTWQVGPTHGIPY
jgi:hypothetical protein